MMLLPGQIGWVIAYKDKFGTFRREPYGPSPEDYIKAQQRAQRLGTERREAIKQLTTGEDVEVPGQPELLPMFEPTSADSQSARDGPDVEQLRMKHKAFHRAKGGARRAYIA